MSRDEVVNGLLQLCAAAIMQHAAVSDMASSTQVHACCVGSASPVVCVVAVGVAVLLLDFDSSLLAYRIHLKISSL